MKKAVCWILCLASNLLVLYLCFQMVDFSNRFAGSILVIAPLIFTLPWWIILGADR